MTQTDLPQWAAGAVAMRGPAEAREIRLVHRPAYDDWTLPKGKAHHDELLPTTAVREVSEESATQIRLSAPLTPSRYPIGVSLKIVSWWIGITVESGEHTPTAEVDQALWLSPDEAEHLLSYADEREVLAEALDLPDTTPLVLLRHAKSENRLRWTKPDRLRPLNRRGLEQRSYLKQILAPFGVTHLVSSPATRCQETLAEYAEEIGADIVTTAALAEETATEREAEMYVARLAKAVGASATPAVVCTHGPFLPPLLASLGIPPRWLGTAGCAVAHVDAKGTVQRTEWYDALRVKA